MEFNQRLNAYAELLVRVGIHIKKGQPLVVRAPIEGRDLVMLVAEHAYKRGASDVHIIWSDEELTLLKYQYAPDEVLNTVYEHQKDLYRFYLEKGAGFLSFTGGNPDLLKQVDPKKLQASTKSRSQALEFYSEAMMSDKNPWTVAGMATKAWAKKVYPHLNSAEGLQQLWEDIFDMARIHEDPIKEWQAHMDTVNGKAKEMTERRFKYLHYENNKGTDFKVELPKGHIWAGGGSSTPDGHAFIANIPTEEVFTLPHKDGADGIVYSTMPLAYNGNVIDEFFLRFESGCVVDYDAKVGKDVLKHLLETDEGSKRLGEVALVPDDSPISNRKQLFYNTLYDENASCHLALGRAYPTCLEGTQNLSKDALASLGVNDSLVHVDFMIGSPDMKIIGIDENGNKTPVFVDGNWA